LNGWACSYQSLPYGAVELTGDRGGKSAGGEEAVIAPLKTAWMGSHSKMPDTWSPSESVDGPSTVTLHDADGNPGDAGHAIKS
jgi:hypothetical protein